MQTNAVTGPYLSGSLGTGEMCDVVVSGNTAIVSNFGDGLFFIDITNPTSPAILGSVDIPSYSEEDLDLTPNGRYVLVTDGGLSNEIHVISVSNRSYVGSLPVSGAQAVDVSPDGQTVLVADSNHDTLLILTIDPATGALIDTSQSISGCTSVVNVTISPDGKTALVSCYGLIKVLRIDGPGVVTETTDISLPVSQFQSIEFSRDGNKAYGVTDAGTLYELNVTGPGNVSYADRSVNLSKNLIPYYGIDQLAINASGDKAYVGGEGKLTVVNLSTMTVEDDINITSTGEISGISLY